MMRPSLITFFSFFAAALHVTQASLHCSHLLEEKQQEIDHLTAELEVCRAPSQTTTPPTPTPTPTEPPVTSPSYSPFTCDGILNGQACCRQGCGSCGGVGCSDRGGGLTGDDCCVSNIEEHGALCSVAGQAPCFVDGTSSPEPTVPAPTPDQATMAPTLEGQAPQQQSTSSGGDVWVPGVGDSWQYNLDTPVNTDVDADVFFIDLDITQDTIDELHAKGKYVSCYISVGTVESWREDVGVFPSSVVGNASGDDSGENWIDITKESVREIMEDRVKKAASKGCDAVEPDNISVWNKQDSGFTISKDEQISYNQWVAELVQENGMKVGMKAGHSLIEDTSMFYDFAVSVECLQWDACDAYQIPFLSEGKPVFNVEYSKDYGGCDGSNSLGIDTIFKNYDLKAPMCSCADSSRDHDCSLVTGFAPTTTTTTTTTAAPAPTPEPPAPSTSSPTTKAPSPAAPTSPPTEGTAATEPPAPSTPTPTINAASSPTPAPASGGTSATESPTAVPGSWVPRVGDSWNYNLDTPVDTDVDVDVFFIDMDNAQDTIDELHAKGKHVACYISVGTVEPWREDFELFPASVIGQSLEEWEAESYLDITQESVREVMEARVQKAASMNCDAVEPNNMSNWNQENTGFTISRDEQVAYNIWFALLVRENGMRVGIKDSFELVGDLNSYYDFAIAECHEEFECGVYTVPFLQKDKPVFNVEYSKNYGVCDGSNAVGIDTIFKNFELDAPLCSCADSSRDVDCDSVVGFPTTEPPAPAPAPTPSTPSPPTATPPPSPTPATPAPTPATPTSPTPEPSTPTNPSPTPPPTPEPSAPTSPAPTPPAPTPPTSGGTWVPKVGDTWNYNLNTPVDTDVDVDVFFIDMDNAQDTIDELHGKGKYVSCYISVGTVESWREDAGAFPSSAVGDSWDDWQGERFLDITQQSVRDLMEARVEKAARMNCDAIEPDNMSNWNQEGTGLTISRDEQVTYNKWFAETVRENGMHVGLKNAIELLGDLSDYYDFGINESCHVWNECGAYKIPFLDKDKPVFNVEYNADYGICDEANEERLDTIFKEYDLNAAMCSCADSSRDVDCSDVTR